MGDRPSDAEVADAFSRLNFDPIIFDEFCKVCKSASATQSFGVGAQLGRMLDSLHMCSWFSTQGVSNVSHTLTGRKPGDPLGALVFSFLMLKVLTAVRSQLQHLGLVEPLPCSGTVSSLFG